MANSDIKENSKLTTIISIAIFIISIAVYYLDPLALQITLYKVLLLLLGVVIASFVFLTSKDGAKFKIFVTQTKMELRKVVWPSKDETIKVTIMIIIAVTIVSIFLWIIDSFWTWVLQLLMN